jgi:O-antigen/teichoic acid export membrane protein
VIRSARTSLAERISGRRVHAQGALFIISAGAGGLISIAAQALLARVLEVGDFAAYVFALSLLQFAAVLFEFGVFIPAARRAALGDPAERRAIVGAALLAYVPIGLSFSVFIFVVSLFIDQLTSVDAGATLELASILAFVFPFSLVAQNLAQGADRLHVYSVSNLIWQSTFATALAAILLAGLDPGSGPALLLRSFCMGAGAVVVCIWLRPTFHGARNRIRALGKDAREYGFPIYVGRVLSTGTYNMDILLVGLFAGTKDVAIYAIAKTLAAGVALLGLGSASALFPRMAKLPELPSAWVLRIGAASAAMAVVLAAVASPLIDVTYGSEFTGAAILVLPLGLAEALRGLGALYNQYQHGHGRGRAIRRAGIAFTTTNMLANFTLIPLFGATGAALASLLAMSVNLIAYVRGYRRTQSEPPVELA